MIKGTKIDTVNIEKDIVIATDNNGNSIKLTRTQRNLLRDYKLKDYEERIIKEFSNPKILSDNFKVIKNGNVVYQKNN